MGIWRLGLTELEVQQFLSLRPKHLLRWELNSENRAVLFRPRLGNHPLALKIEGMFSIPEYRIRLDKIGTAVWGSMDGATSLMIILEDLVQELGEDQQQVLDRLKLFVDQMFRSRMMEL